MAGENLQETYCQILTMSHDAHTVYMPGCFAAHTICNLSLLFFAGSAPSRPPEAGRGL